MRAFCALAALLVAALAAPAIALAAPATQEYDLALPEADGDSETEATEDETAAVAPPTSTPPTAPGPETVAPVAPAAEDGGAGGKPEPRDRSRPRRSAGDTLFASPAPQRPIENLNTSGSGGGGFPALLVLLGAIAGTCAGFAIWRLRRTGTRPPGSAGTDISGGTQST
jgi:hypothetical protein